MNFKVINELSKEVHQNAVAKGFWENNPSDEHFLCLVISELMEAVEADRKDRHADMDFFNRVMSAYIPEIGSEELYFKRHFAGYVKDTVEDELSDAFIRLLDLAGEVEAYIEDDSIYSNLCYFISKDKTFTENIYEIVKLVTDKFPLSIVHLRDLFLHIIELARILGFDLEYHVRLKMRYNSMREYKHVKAY